MTTKQYMKGDVVKPTATNFLRASGFIAIGIAIAFAGIYVGETDDAPGAALMGIVLMIVMVVLGVKNLRRKTHNTTSSS